MPRYVKVTSLDPLTKNSAVQIDKLFGVSTTTRNWSTIIAVIRILRSKKKGWLIGSRTCICFKAERACPGAFTARTRWG